MNFKSSFCASERQRVIDQPFQAMRSNFLQEWLTQILAFLQRHQKAIIDLYFTWKTIDKTDSSCMSAWPAVAPAAHRTSVRSLLLFLLSSAKEASRPPGVAGYH
jgi:hypothetical protein